MNSRTPDDAPEDQELLTDTTEQEFTEAWQESDDTPAGEQPGAVVDPADEEDGFLDDGSLDKDDPLPAAIVPPAGSTDADDDEEEIDSIRAETEKLQQRLRSAEGRLRNNHNPKLESEVEAMRQQLEQLHQHLGIQSPEPAERRDTPADETIPDGFTKAEWEVFKNDYPENAKELLEKSEGGQNKEITQRLAKLEADREARAMEEARQKFNKPILDTHPDYEEICTQRAADVMAFVQAIDDPVKRQGAEVVIQQGNPEQIIALVSEFKAWNAKHGTRKTQTQSTRDASAAVAVPGRGGARPSVSASGVKNKDDYEAAWKEADVT